jgi:hypothetical protein
MVMRVRFRYRAYALLTEVLLGLSLVLVALLTVFHLFVSADSMVAVADQTSQADQLARRVLEEELNRPYDDVEAYTGAESVPHVERRGAQLSTNFEYEVDVAQPDLSKNVKLVSVRVSWGEKPHHQVSLTGSKGELW